MIIKNQNLTREILVKFLMQGICQVSFEKLKDGTNRIILCTLEPSLIPSNYLSSVRKVLAPSGNTDILPVWEVSEGKWKSFKISNLNDFRTPDELLTADKPGQDLDSKQKQIIEKLKKDAEKKFQKLVAELKQEALDAKKKLNGE